MITSDKDIQLDLIDDKEHQKIDSTKVPDSDVKMIVKELLNSKEILDVFMFHKPDLLHHMIIKFMT